VAHGDGHDAAKKIEIPFAFHIPQVLHAGVVGHQWIAVVGENRRKQVLLVFLDDFVSGHEHLHGGTASRFNMGVVFQF
jgi:hypothetical protein